MEQRQHENLLLLTDVVQRLLRQADIIQTIDRLKEDVRVCKGPFVWSVIHTSCEISQRMPANIKSAWIFVLKKGARSISHFHPNSVQHMALVEGMGNCEIGGVRTAMRRFDSSIVVEDVWMVIDQNVPHEFFPEQIDMVVFSFHTCAAEDLIEIEGGTGRQRRYEMPPNT